MSLLAFSLTAADAVLVIIVLAFFSVGFIKGFSKIFTSFFGTLLGLVLAFLLCNKFALLMDDAFGFIDKLAAALNKKLPAMGEYMNMQIYDETSLMSALNSSSLPSFLKRGAFNLLSPLLANSEALPVTLSSLLSLLFAYYIMIAISFIVLFILVKLIFIIISSFLPKATFTPLKVVDKILGGAIGLFKAAVVVYLLLLIISLLPASFMAPVNENIQSSVLVKYLSDTNLLGKFFGKLIDYTYLSEKLSST